jgi:hypothetical protein
MPPGFVQSVNKATLLLISFANQAATGERLGSAQFLCMPLFEKLF